MNLRTADRSCTELAAFAEAAVASAERRRPLAIHLPLAPCAPRDLLGVEAADGFYWRDRHDEGIAGIGSAALLSATGPDRFDRVRRAADALLEGLQVRSCGDAGPPPVRFFGGFSFRPGTGDDPIWGPLGDARFVLPELSCCFGAGQDAWLTLCLPARRGAGEEAGALERLGAALGRVASRRPTRRGLGAAARPSANGVAGGDDGGGYRALVTAALEGIGRRELDKVVVARRVSTAWPDMALPDLVDALDASAGTFRFALASPGRLFLGATPERLVALSDGTVRTEAVAGTSSDGDGGVGPLDRRTKDLWEHELVVRAIQAALEPVSCLRHEAAPRIRPAGRVRHLATSFEGELRGDGHVLDLVRRLHPTPAVGGWPTEPALRWLAENEPSARGWYAGPIGWFDAAGEGEFAVALRCGLAHDGILELFAGSGIVVGSDPGAECEETRVKLRALPEMLGLA